MNRGRFSVSITRRLRISFVGDPHSITWQIPLSPAALAVLAIFITRYNIGHSLLFCHYREPSPVFRSERNRLQASIRGKQTRMKEINRLRQAIRDYARTKSIYSQYKESGWSPRFYNEHRQEIETHRKAQNVYSSVEGRMPSQKELSDEYAILRTQKDQDNDSLEELKPKMKTLNQIRYNFHVLERDELPEPRTVQRGNREAR